VSLLAAGAVAVGTHGIVVADDLRTFVAPDDEVFAVIAATDGDGSSLGAALDGLVAWTDGQGRALVDREPELEWIEAWQLADLRSGQLAPLSASGRPPLAEALGDTELADAILARAGGVLSVSSVGCSIEAVGARPGWSDGDEGAEHDRLGPIRSRERSASIGDDRLAWTEHRRMRRLRAPTEPSAPGFAAGPALVGFATTSDEVWSDDGHVLLAQRHELEIWLDEDEGRTSRLVAAWTEMSSGPVSAASRIWDSWELARASDEAAAWTAACAGRGPWPDAVGGPRSPPGGGATSPSTDASSAPRTPAPVAPATGLPGPISGMRGLCAGVVMVEIPPSFEELLTMQEEADTMLLEEPWDELGGSEPPPGFPTSWSSTRDAGLVQWALVLGLDEAALSVRERARLVRLVEAFGPWPEHMPAQNKARLRARYRRGLLDEALDQKPIRVPVCPRALRWTEAELGSLADRFDVALVAGATVLESGGPWNVPAEQWDAIRQSIDFGNQLQSLFETPVDDLGPIGIDL